MMGKSKPKDKKKKKRDQKREQALSNWINIPEETLQYPGERGYTECPCPKKCTIHGECLLCVAYHARKDQFAFCER